MYIGVLIAPTEYSIRIDELARETEARGFESLWVPEHTHIPVSRRTPAHHRAPGADLTVCSIRCIKLEAVRTRGGGPNELFGRFYGSWGCDRWVWLYLDRNLNIRCQ